MYDAVHDGPSLVCIYLGHRYHKSALIGHLCVTELRRTCESLLGNR